MLVQWASTFLWPEGELQHEQSPLTHIICEGLIDRRMPQAHQEFSLQQRQSDYTRYSLDLTAAICAHG
jgi:hypothetical protein